MLSLVRQSARVVTACVLVTIFAVPPSLLAQAQIHVVSPADLHHATVAASETRQHNLDTVSNFLSSPAAQIALTSAHMDSAKVKAAVSSLSDEELAQLASRANKAQADFAAGNLTDRDLLIILLAVAALVLIIVAVR
ncbi:MAG TPA: PA2779 family protein [Terriglobales bacterium]|nr:PA2779 family protein [Terriglobales bacterium]